jgi:hypothetical protein
LKYLALSEVEVIDGLYVVPEKTFHVYVSEETFTELQVSVDATAYKLSGCVRWYVILEAPAIETSTAVEAGSTVTETVATEVCPR